MTQEHICLWTIAGIPLVTIVTLGTFLAFRSIRVVIATWAAIAIVLLVMNLPLTRDWPWLFAFLAGAIGANLALQAFQVSPTLRFILGNVFVLGMIAIALVLAWQNQCLCQGYLLFRNLGCAAVA